MRAGMCSHCGSQLSRPAEHPEACPCQSLHGRRWPLAKPVIWWWGARWHLAFPSTWSVAAVGAGSHETFLDCHVELVHGWEKEMFGGVLQEQAGRLRGRLGGGHTWCPDPACPNWKAPKRIFA